MPIGSVSSVGVMKISGLLESRRAWNSRFALISVISPMAARGASASCGGAELVCRPAEGGERGQGVSTPTMAPKRHVVSVPETIDFRPSEITSPRFGGHIVESPAIMMPSEPKLAKPHMA